MASSAPTAVTAIGRPATDPAGPTAEQRRGTRSSALENLYNALALNVCPLL